MASSSCWPVRLLLLLLFLACADAAGRPTPPGGRPQLQQGRQQQRAQPPQQHSTARAAANRFRQSTSASLSSSTITVRDIYHVYFRLVMMILGGQLCRLDDDVVPVVELLYKYGGWTALIVACVGPSRLLQPHVEPKKKNASKDDLVGPTASTTTKTTTPNKSTAGTLFWTTIRIALAFGGWKTCANVVWLLDDKNRLLRHAAGASLALIGLAGRHTTDVLAALLAMLMLFHIVTL